MDEPMGSYYLMGETMMNNIRQAVDNLPKKSVTVYALQALDFVVPGEWQNIVNFGDMVRHVTGESDPAGVRHIAARAVELYNAPNHDGYQRALWLYQVVDKADTALGAAAMANKVGEKIGFLSFLNRLTPKADIIQAIDLGLKVVAELVAFSQMNGLPTDKTSFERFSSALTDDYRAESLMRMTALVCLDGIIPLGPDFTGRVSSILGGVSPSDLHNNALFNRIGDIIPGQSTSNQLSFVNESFGSVQGWMNKLLSSRNLTPEKVVGNMQRYIDFTDDKLDYLAAFLDLTTNYFTHTGTQSLAHNLIERAADQT
jgi:hypothetical protein